MRKWLRPSTFAALFRRWRNQQLTRIYDWRYPNAGDVPTVGRQIYVPSQFYLSHGQDDFVGGRARVKRVETDQNPSVWIEIEERPGTMYSWESLGPKQNHLRATYGNTAASPNPDRRPEFNRWD